MLCPTTRRVSIRTRSFTRFPGFGCDAQLDFPSWSDPKRKTEELSFRGASNRALGLVDAELQPRIEATHRLHHTFARPLGPNVDVQIICVAHKRVSAFLKLLIDLVQEHVRQDWR